MPVSEGDATQLLLVLDALVAEHARRLTPSTVVGKEAYERLKPVMRFLVELRLVMVCQNYTAAIKPLLVAAMRETACLAHPLACPPYVVLEAERRVWRLSAAIDHYLQSTIDLLGGGSFTAAQMSAAVEMVRSVHLVLQVSDSASSGSSGGSWGPRAQQSSSSSSGRSSSQPPAAAAAPPTEAETATTVATATDDSISSRQAPARAPPPPAPRVPAFSLGQQAAFNPSASLLPGITAVAPPGRSPSRAAAAPAGSSSGDGQRSSSSSSHHQPHHHHHSSSSASAQNHAHSSSSQQQQQQQHVYGVQSRVSHSPVTSQQSESRDHRESDTSGSGSASRNSYGSYKSEAAAAGAAFYACVDEIVRAVCPLLEGIACNMIITTHLGVRLPATGSTDSAITSDPTAASSANSEEQQQRTENERSAAALRGQHSDGSSDPTDDSNAVNNANSSSGGRYSARTKRSSSSWLSSGRDRDSFDASNSANNSNNAASAVINAPSPHMQLEETCKLLRLGYHKVPPFYRAVLSLVSRAISQDYDSDLIVTPETNNWDRYTMLIYHRRLRDLYVMCCFTPSVNSVMMGVRVARLSDPCWGYSAGSGDGDARACAAITIAAIDSALIAPYRQQHRSRLRRHGWLLALGELIRQQRAQPLQQSLQQQQQQQQQEEQEETSAHVVGELIYKSLTVQGAAGVFDRIASFV